MLIWISVVNYSDSSTVRISRMAIAGQTIVIFIVWFQFCVSQIIAGVMLSNSISDEIYHKTLGLLMTTPINSFQIVMGKLLSKLLQTFLLMAISLPLLAIIRVFGGIPWDYLISSLCITFSTIFFIGSLSLFFSIFCRRTYVTIIITILTISAAFALFPILFWLLVETMNLDRMIPEKILTGVTFIPNPYLTMFLNTLEAIEPQNTSGIFYSWPINCGIILGTSAFLLSLSVIFVRKVALSQVNGQAIITIGRKQKYINPVIRRVKDPPVLWKELRHSTLGSHKIRTIIFLLIALGLLFLTYWLCAKDNILDEKGTHILYAIIFLGLGILFTIIYPATNITSEKEARSWHLLLTTTLDEKQILSGKFIGNLRRLLPAWCLLFGHVIIFSLDGMIHPVAIFQYCILVTWIVVFLSCTGMYFSARFKRTTTAVVMNFILALSIWAVIPLVLSFIVEIIRNGYSDGWIELYYDTNPFVQAVVIMDAVFSGSRWQINNYNWVSFRQMDVVESTAWMLGCLTIYTFLGLLFARRAKYLLRRNIF
ncbi:ABC transporter permease subunit [Planctomycetota bacterium]